MRRAVFLIALAIHAQDADQVLRTMVGYNALQSRRHYPAEQSDEIAELARQGQAAAREQTFGDALRHFHHGIALMQGEAWTPETELAFALELQLANPVIDRGQQTRVTLTPLYPLTRPATTTLTITLRNRTESLPLTSNQQITTTALPLEIPLTIPAQAQGNYTLLATIGTQRKAIPLLVSDLAQQAAQLKARLQKTDHPTAAYALVEYENAANFANKSLAEANKILDAVEAGQDPFANKTGDMRKAYRSQVDQTLQPYRLYVPTKKPAGLVIALHGMGGNENSLFDGYGRTNALQRAAEQYGFLVACPKGRGPTSMYKGTAEQDVLDVLAEVQKDYAIDPKRIFLMGHSMGAFGTWSLAMAYPEKWAALGPISGGGDPTGMERIKDIPQYVVHGDNDRTVPVTLSRLMVNAAKKLDAKIEYHEIPGGTHNGVVAPHFAPLLAFFAGIPLNTVPH